MLSKMCTITRQTFEKNTWCMLVSRSIIEAIFLSACHMSRNAFFFFTSIFHFESNFFADTWRTNPNRGIYMIYIFLWPWRLKLFYNSVAYQSRVWTVLKWLCWAALCSIRSPLSAFESSLRCIIRNYEAVYPRINLRPWWSDHPVLAVWICISSDHLSDHPSLL